MLSVMIPTYFSRLTSDSASEDHPTAPGFGNAMISLLMQYHLNYIGYNGLEVSVPGDAAAGLMSYWVIPPILGLHGLHISPHGAFSYLEKRALSEFKSAMGSCFPLPCFPCRLGGAPTWPSPSFFPLPTLFPPTLAPSHPHPLTQHYSSICTTVFVVLQSLTAAPVVKCAAVQLLGKLCLPSVHCPRLGTRKTSDSVLNILHATLTQ